MRVLMLTDFYPPDCIGGVERHVQTLSRELVSRGHDVTVGATRNRAESPQFELDMGVRVHRLTGWGRVLTPFYPSSDYKFHPPAPDPGIAAGVWHLLKQERPDIVHAHTWMMYSFAPLKVWTKAKFVVTFHTYGLVCPKTTLEYDGQVCAGAGFMKCIHCLKAQYGTVPAVLEASGWKLSSYLHRYVDRYTVVSSAVLDASRKGVCGRPIEVVPPVSISISDCVDYEPSSLGRPDFLPQDDDYILFVGRQYAHQRKGLDVLLDAYSGLHEPPPLLVIVAEQETGTPQQFPAGVRVVHSVPHTQVMAAWAHCAVGVVPSLWQEPFGLVAVEAMSKGKPVIASAVGGLRDIVVDGETGVLVPPGDVSALREALRMLLSDPPRRARMGAAARERALQFVSERLVDRTVQIYNEVMRE